VHGSTRIEHPLAQCGRSGGGPRKQPHSGVSPNPPSTWVEAGKKRRAAHRCRGVQRHDRGLSSAAAERRPSLTPRAVVSCRVSSARAGAASGTVTCRRCVGPWSNGRAALRRIRAEGESRCVTAKVAAAHRAPLFGRFMAGPLMRLEVVGGVGMGRICGQEPTWKSRLHIIAPQAEGRASVTAGKPNLPFVPCPLNEVNGPKPRQGRGSLVGDEQRGRSSWRPPRSRPRTRSPIRDAPRRPSTVTAAAAAAAAATGWGAHARRRRHP